MPSLLDIAPPELTAEEIDIRGTKLKVQGIAGEGWMTLYARHPAMRAIVSGRTEGLSNLESFASQVALVAAGIGAVGGVTRDAVGDMEMERWVMHNLWTDEQGPIMATIMRLSLPGHIFGPLLAEGVADAAAAPSTAAPGTKSPRRPRN